MVALSPRQDPVPEITPTLETAADIRADLHRALIETEDAIAAAAPGRFAEWTEAVLKALVHVHTAFHSHIEIAEGDDGIYEEVLDREPRLIDTVNRIKAEHPQILAMIHEPYNRLRLREVDEFIPAEEIRDAVMKVLAKITKHRQKGADLVWEAYFVDLGGLD
jgi:hypothetical protein